MMKLLGLVLILGGLWAILLALAFASMIDPSLSDAAWWAEYLRRLMTESVGLAFCLLMVLGGAWLMGWVPTFSKRDRAKSPKTTVYEEV